jgi:hypothetical protein
VSLFALLVSVTLSLGASGVAFERVSVDPWLLVRSEGATPIPLLMPEGAGGFTMPGIVWASTTNSKSDVLEHENQHVTQFRALGVMGFTVVNAVTGGRVFEDYLGGNWMPPQGTPIIPLFSWSPRGGLTVFGVGGASEQAEVIHDWGVRWARDEHPGRTIPLAVQAAGGAGAR